MLFWSCIRCRQPTPLATKGKHMNSSCLEVILSRDIFRLFTRYQCGIYYDEREILHGKRLRLSEYTVDVSEYQFVDQILSRWYRVHGIYRLELLVCPDYRHLLRVVFLHAVYFGLLQVLEYLDQWTQILTQQDPRRRYSGRAIDGRLQVIHNHDLFDLAANLGNLNVIQFLHQHDYQQTSPRAIQRAVLNGHCTLVEYLYRNQLSVCTSRVLDLAAEGGHLDIVRFLHQQPLIACTKRAVDHAAANGHILVVKFLMENRIEGGTHKAVLTAKANGHTEVVHYLYSKMVPHTSYVKMDN